MGILPGFAMNDLDFLDDLPSKNRDFMGCSSDFMGVLHLISTEWDFLTHLDGIINRMVFTWLGAPVISNMKIVHQRTVHFHLPEDTLPKQNIHWIAVAKNLHRKWKA